MKLTGGTRNFESNVWVHDNMHSTTLTVDEPVELTGSIETASALETARTILLSGDVSGSISFDGSTDVDIVTIIADDSHIHDTRYYTETEVDTNIYTKTQLDAGQLDNRYYTETEIDNTFLPLTGGEISSDLTVSGDFTVNGTTTTVNTTELLVEDNLITVNSGQTGTPLVGLLSGIEVERGDEINYHFLFRESDDTFVIGEAGSEQSVATREDSPVDFGISYWDAATISLVTLANSGTTGKVLTSNGAAAPSWETGSEGTEALTSGSESIGALKYNGIAALEGTLHGGASDPIGVEALTYNGYFSATKIFNAVYNDVAEFVYFSKPSQPGQVLVIKNGKVQPSSGYGMKTVIGVHSDTFGYALGSADKEKKTSIGLVGRVNVWINEPCKEGDLLISSVKGFAAVKKWYDLRKGIVLGKVMQNKKDSTPERVEMLIMLS